MPVEVIVAGMSLIGTLAGTFGGISIAGRPRERTALSSLSAKCASTTIPRGACRSLRKKSALSITD